MHNQKLQSQTSSYTVKIELLVDVEVFGNPDDPQVKIHLTELEDYSKEEQTEFFKEAVEDELYKNHFEELRAEIEEQQRLEKEYFELEIEELREEAA